MSLLVARQPLSSDPSSPNAVSIALCQLCSFRLPAEATPDRLVCAECSDGQGRDGPMDQPVFAPAAAGAIQGQLNPASLQAYLAPERDPELTVLVRDSADGMTNQLRAAVALRQSQLNVSASGHPSLEHTVHSTLAAGEKLTFSLAVESFQFPQGSMMGSHNAGLLLLTDQRMICLTQCRHNATTMAWEGQTSGIEAQLRSQLRVQHSTGASLWIFPIAHKSLKHLVLESDHHVQASNVITPMLFGPSSTGITIGILLLAVFGVLAVVAGLQKLSDVLLYVGIGIAAFGLIIVFASSLTGQQLYRRADCCNRYQVQVGPIPSGTAAQSHSLHIAILMPPWDQQQILRVAVDPRVPLSKLHQFSAHFQSVLTRNQEPPVERPAVDRPAVERPVGLPLSLRPLRLPLEAPRVLDAPR